MDLRIFVEPQQGASYERQLAVAKTAEAHGFDAFFRSDHLLVIGGQPTENEGGLPGPTDSWVTLGGIARETEHDPPRHDGHLGHVPTARDCSPSRWRRSTT